VLSRAQKTCPRSGEEEKLKTGKTLGSRTHRLLPKPLEMTYFSETGGTINAEIKIGLQNYKYACSGQNFRLRFYKYKDEYAIISLPLL
jgi:hypothetical protein